MKTIVLTLLLSFTAAPAWSDVISHENNDVQLVQAYRTTQLLTLDLQRCSGTLPKDTSYVTLDCSRALPFAGPLAAPALTLAYFYQGRLGARNGSGNTVEVRLAVKTSVLDSPAFSGIGFFSQNNSFQGVSRVAKKDLLIESHRRLHNGEPVAIVKFVFWFPGIAGHSGTGWSMDSVEFKPFAEFRTNGHTYQNWEAIQANWQVYRADNGAGRPQNTSIERWNEILQ